MTPSVKHTLLRKGFCDETTNCAEFHTCDSDEFLELINDLPFRGMSSIRRNQMTKIHIVSGQEYYACFPEGTGIVVSLLVDREFVFTFNLAKEETDKFLVTVSKK